MSILPKIYSLKDEAQAELYQLFDERIRKLPRDKNGVIDKFAEDLVDNDVDAMRHAYVSGVYTLEFGEGTAEILGRLNELGGIDYSSNAAGAENMDLWNNAVGRRAAKKVSDKRALFDELLKFMKNNELILHPADPRKFKGEKLIKKRPKSFVIKIKESRTGANIEFLDVRIKKLITKDQFIQAIRAGSYPGYAIRKHFNGEFPYSTRDKYSFNNLG